MWSIHDHALRACMAGRAAEEAMAEQSSEQHWDQEMEAAHAAMDSLDVWGPPRGCPASMHPSRQLLRAWPQVETAWD